MSKHAYLILAHTAPQQLQMLVDCLDYPDNDIFIHWDLNAGMLPPIHSRFSPVAFVSDRHKVYWGDFSVVEAEYSLFRESRQRYGYSYYHLLSGMDLPIKRQQLIHEECGRCPGIEYVGFSKQNEKEIRWRAGHRFLFPKKFNSKSVAIRGCRKLSNLFQNMLFLNRNKTVAVKKGPQWISVTGDFADYILANEMWVRKTFAGTYCPDEMFVQTLCWNSAFKNRVCSPDDEFAGCRRYINWIDGELKTICGDDLKPMAESDRWFARKFSPDENVKDVVYREVRYE